MCAWSLRNSRGQHVENRLRVDSNVKLVFNTKDCPGHGNKVHGAPLWIKRKDESTLSLPDSWVEDLITDIQNIIDKHEKKSDTHWSCKKCKHGGKYDGEHTYDKG